MTGKSTVVHKRKAGMFTVGLKRKTRKTTMSHNRKTGETTIVLKIKNGIITIEHKKRSQRSQWVTRKRLEKPQKGIK